MNVTDNGSKSDPRSIRLMFDAIAPTYDLLNHIMSFGLDIHWRKLAVDMFTKKQEGIFLDIASGSGDVAMDILRLQPAKITATDFSLSMLDVFQQKLSSNREKLPITLAACDALNLPFRKESFDGTIVAFGIRNFADKSQSLKEMHRVLKPNGESVILELTKPKQPIISQLYKLYAEIFLPFIGRIISKHNSAYSYLPKSITRFPEQKEFLSLMNAAGFIETRAKFLAFGSATVFYGKKSTAG